MNDKVRHQSQLHPEENKFHRGNGAAAIREVGTSLKRQGRPVLDEHHEAALWSARTEIARLRDLLRLVADEPNIDKARALADAELHGNNA